MYRDVLCHTWWTKPVWCEVLTAVLLKIYHFQDVMLCQWASNVWSFEGSTVLREVWYHSPRDPVFHLWIEHTGIEISSHNQQNDYPFIPPVKFFKPSVHPYLLVCLSSIDIHTASGMISVTVVAQSRDWSKRMLCTAWRAGNTISMADCW